MSGKALNTKFTVFDLIRSRIEPTIYQSKEEDFNQYAAKSVSMK